MPERSAPACVVRIAPVSISEPRDVADLMRPAEPGFFEAVPVSDKVNKVANMGPELQERVEPAERIAAPPAEAAERDAQLKLF
jgi:hypothetical protein